MGECIIREATGADKEALESTSRSALAFLRQTYRPTSKATAQKHLADPALTQLIAFLGSKPVASVKYGVEDDYLYFLSLFVHEDFRRQGIGRRLVAELDTIARRLGLRRLSANTVKEAGTHEVFQRMGFDIVSEEATNSFESDQFSQLTEVHVVRDIL
jgi:GNAT superfamily N-acetyltransferase